AEMDHALHVLGRAAQGALQHNADVPVTEVPDRFEEIEGGLRGARALHVDPDEEVEALSEVEDASHVVDRRSAIGVETELSEFQRRFSASPRADLRVDDLEILSGRALRIGWFADALAEEIERDSQPLLFQRLRRLDRLVDGHPRDEAAGEARAPHAIGRRKALQPFARRQEMEQSLREEIEHQWGRAPECRDALNRCSIDRA